MTHIHHFSVMIVDNGFVIQENFRHADKTITLVARTEEELIEAIKKYVTERKKTE